jgi:hypothetical protein
MPRSYESGSDYIIKSVKLKKNGTTVEIRNNVVQIEVFENINLPYLTARLYVKDDARIFDVVGFDGVEVCEITFSQPGVSPNIITKTFVIRSVADTVKITDLDEAVSLYLIEKIGYDGSLERFSKSYTGTPLDIIKKIADDKLKIKINPPVIVPIQKEMRVVIPYMTPLEAIAFVLERATTLEGLPYYFYSSLNNSLLQIKSLEELLKSAPWNKGKPYRYSRAFTQGHTNNASKQDPFVVQKYFAPTDGENTFSLVTNGAISGQFSVFDFTTGRNETKHFDITKVFRKLESKGVVPKGMTQVIETKYADKQLQTLQSVNVHRSIMVNTYEDVRNYYQDDTIDLYELDMIRKAIKTILTKSPINLKVPGGPFLSGTNNSIGRQIEYFHLNNDITASELPNASPDKIRDKKRSGTYMIFTAHHTFFNTRHTVELSAVKLGKEPT